MSEQAHNAEEVLAQLVRKAGDPCAEPDPQYVERLRATILDRLAPASTTDDARETIREADAVSILALNGVRRMKRFARIAVAATVLAVTGSLACWLTIGGSTDIAFADVAKALANVRTATFDHMTEVKNPWDGKQNTYRSKIMFLAPSRERSMDPGFRRRRGHHFDYGLPDVGIP